MSNTPSYLTSELIARGIGVSPKLASNIVAQEGDSRAAAFGAKTATQAIKYNRGIPFNLEFLSKGRIACPLALNFGTNGATSADIASRIATSVATAKAAGAVAMIVMGGSTNDRLAGLTLAQTVANLTAVEMAIVGAGLICIWVAELPRGATGFAGLALTGQPLQDHIGAELFVASRANQKSVYVARPWSRIADRSTLANNQAGYAASGITYDGLHPSPNGAMEIAQAVLPIIDRLFPAISISAQSGAEVYSTTNTKGLKVSNPLMIGTGGTLNTGVTGNIAAGWTGKIYPASGSTLAVACSKVAGADGFDRQRLVFSGTAGSGFEYFALYQDLNVGTSGLAIGALLGGEALIQVAVGQTGLSAVFECLTGSGAATPDFSQAGTPGQSSDIFSPRALDGLIRLEPMPLPAASTSLRTALRVQVQPGATVAATIDVECLGSRLAA